MSGEVYVCELCGETFYGKPIIVDLDGYRAYLCGNCARRVKRSGKPKGEDAAVTRKEAPVKQQLRKEQTGSRVRRKEPLEEIELIEDYGKKIREARESLGLSIEQVAAALNIKASLLRNIEAGRVVPSHEVARSIEKLLEVSIIQRNPEKIQVTGSAVQPSVLSSITLGEIVEVKKKRRRKK